MYGYGYMDMDMDTDTDVDMDMDMDIDVYHRPNLELACNVGCRLFLCVLCCVEVGLRFKSLLKAKIVLETEV